MKTKSIHYAYPNSSAAILLGYKHTGCYYVTVGDPHGLKPHNPFASLEQAEHYADSLELPYSKWSIKTGIIA